MPRKYHSTKLKYLAIKQEYHQHKSEGVSLQYVWQKFIWPKFFISRTTLYTILNTPDSELNSHSV